MRSALPQTLARTLARGITSVVDTGVHFGLYDVHDLAETLPAAPRTQLRDRF